MMINFDFSKVFFKGFTKFDVHSVGSRIAKIVSRLTGSESFPSSMAFTKAMSSKASEMIS